MENRIHGGAVVTLEAMRQFYIREGIGTAYMREMTDAVQKRFGKSGNLVPIETIAELFGDHADTEQFLRVVFSPEYQKYNGLKNTTR